MDELKKDSRFAHIAKDPRFRPASQKERKLKIDRRFASMFNDPKFKLKYTVDKRGRPLLREHTTRDDMKKFYHLDDDEQSSASSSDEESKEQEQKKKKKQNQKITGDEDLDEMLKSDESESEEEEEEEEENEEDKKSSSSEEDEDIPDADDGVEWNDFDDKCARSEDVSRRLAVCNMDWDRVRAADIFVLLNSWKPSEGVIKSVTIYPSEYGLKQMELEKQHGPLPDATKPVEVAEQNGTDSGHQSDVEDEPEDPEVKLDDDDDKIDPETFNQDDDPDTTDPVIRERLRKYQLNRLKYYYAVVECDTVETAAKIYEECDGMEYETSAVRLDLRFIPDDVTFDSSIPPHDQCTELPDKSVYKPILFRNTALTQTKVRCTWDETPIERRRLLKKKYTLEELEKVDLDAYLATDSEDDLNNDDQDDNAASDLDDDEEENDQSKKKDDGVFKVPAIPAASGKSSKDQPIARAPSVLSSQDDIDRYRALLLDFNDDEKKGKKSKKKLTNFFDDVHSDGDDENGESSGKKDDEEESDASDIDMEITWQPGLKGKGDDRLVDPEPKTESKKNKKNKKKDKANVSKDQDDEEERHQRETLELLTADDDADGKKDYNLRQMMKEHKQSLKATPKNAKKSKKFQGLASDVSKDQSNNDGFQLNVNDQRFQAVFNQPAFNIDQSDPHYRPTAGTQQIIEEKLKKRKLDQRNGSSKSGFQDDDLVTKLKRKAAKKDE